jgi:purine-binding chemotaxis protein CheW
MGRALVDMNKLIKKITALSSSAPSEERNYLALAIDHEDYAIDILKIQGILIYKDLNIKKLMNMPPYLKGLAQVYNEIMPLIDLRSLYNLSPLEFNESTVVIVLKDAKKSIGVIVDSVLDIISLSAEHIKPRSEFYNVVYSDHIEGIGTQDGGNIFTILDVEKLIFICQTEDLRDTLEETAGSIEEKISDRKG